MEGHEVKALVLAWLAETAGSLDEFGQLLGDAAADDLTYGEIDPQGNFQALTEAQMASQSLAALEAYKLDRDGVSHDQVGEWLDSIGSEHPLPCPR